MADQLNTLEQSTREANLFKIHQKTAREMSRRYISFRTSLIDQDDLEALAYKALVKAIRQWDESKGQGFKQYLHRKIMGEMSEMFRKLSKTESEIPHSFSGCDDMFNDENIEKAGINKYGRFCHEYIPGNHW